LNYGEAKPLLYGDASGAYVKRWVEEIDTPEYPEPIVDHTQAVRAFRAARDR